MVWLCNGAAPILVGYTSTTATLGDVWIDLYDPNPEGDCHDSGSACGATGDFDDLKNLAEDKSVDISHLATFKCDKCVSDDKRCFKYKLDGGSYKVEAQECTKNKYAVCSITCSK